MKKPQKVGAPQRKSKTKRTPPGRSGVRSSSLARRSCSSESPASTTFHSGKYPFAYALHKPVVDGNGSAVDYIFLEVNQAFETVTGKSASELVGHTIREVLSGSAPMWIESLNSMKADGKRPRVVKDSKNRDLTIHPLPAKNGNVAVRVEQIVDAKQGRAQAASEPLLSDIIDAVPFGAHLYELKPGNRLEFVGANKSADRILAIDHSGLVGKPIEEAFPALRDTELPDEYRRVAGKGGRFERELVEYRDDRISGAFEVSAIQTAPNRLIVFFRDITERQRAIDEINLDRIRLQQLFENSPSGLAMLDTQDRILSINKAFESIFLYRPEEVCGLHINDVIVPTNLISEARDLSRLSLDGQTVRKETLRRRKDGSLVPVAIAGIPIIIRGKNVGVYAIYQDLTDRKRVEAVQSALVEISRAALVTGELDQLLEIIHRELTKLIDTTNFYVALYDKQSKKYSFPFYVDEYDELEDFEPKDLSKSLTDYIRRTGKPLLVDQKTNDELVKQGEIELVGTPSPIWVGVPLKIGDEVIGVVGVQSYTNATLYSTSDVDLLTLVSDHIAQVIKRKQVEEALRENEERLRIIFEFAPVGYFMYDLTGKLLGANRAAESATGYSREELIDKNLLEVDIIPQSEIMKALTLLAKNVQGESTGPDEFRFLRKGGGSVILEISTIPITIQNQTIVLATVRDITTRKATEAQIRLQSSALGATANAIVITDREGEIIWVNPAFTSMSGYQMSEIIGKTLRVLEPEAKEDGVYRAMWKSLAEGREWRGEIVNRRKDGTTYREEMSITPVRTETGELTHFVAVKQDITARKQTEEKMREQAALLDEAHDAIIVRDFEGRITYWNKGAERLYGWPASDVVGNTGNELLYRQDLPTLIEAQKLVLEKGEWKGELRQLTKANKEIVVQSRWTLVRDVDGRPKSVLVINTDVTEKKTLESQFLRSQRMESIGVLAGGIAHDLNNVLAPILMAVHILEKKVSDDSGKNMLRTMEKSANRGAAIVRQVLAFARGLEGERVLIQPQQLSKEIAGIVGETFPKSIQLATEFNDTLWTVMGDPTQLHQVLLNLCVNARDAMPNGGSLRLGGENIILDEQYARVHVDAKPGAYVMLSVADTGTGIHPDTLDKIFEPFFTTKEFGKGTGLGLSTAYSIIKAHGGFINVYSEVGHGTTFKLYLPAEEPTTQKGLEERTAVLPGGAGETILVVDDESAVREITKLTLESYGYKVILASDGTDAVAQFAKRRKDISLVLLDMMMPYMDGPATIRALMKVNPDVKILAASGQMQRDAFQETHKVAGFLLKPYTAEKLLRAVAKVLGKLSREL